MSFDRFMQNEYVRLDGVSISDHLPKDTRLSAGKRIGYLIFALCFLIGLALLPSLAERISFALTRGAEAAKRVEAEKFLAEMPDASSRIPWIVKTVGPGTVGIQAGMGNESSIGTGVILTENGYVLTNYHVIAPKGREIYPIEVVLHDGRRQLEARIVGTDSTNDLAVLKIELMELYPIHWGKSDELDPGDTVVAIGNPYGLDHSVSMGILSAKKRYNITSDGVVVQEFLQTDAAINPGNSGGPLVNLRGEVIGINTAIFGESYQGISFAVPAELAQQCAENIIRDDQ